jgi:hypothetical protein
MTQFLDIKLIPINTMFWHTTAFSDYARTHLLSNWYILNCKILHRKNKETITDDIDRKTKRTIKNKKLDESWMVVLLINAELNCFFRLCEDTFVVKLIYFELQDFTAAKSLLYKVIILFEKCLQMIWLPHAINVKLNLYNDTNTQAKNVKTTELEKAI